MLSKMSDEKERSRKYDAESEVISGGQEPHQRSDCL